MLGYSFMLRTHAAFHSAFVMCVSRSQKPMQSARVLPPPPGALGADSLGLAEELPGDSARPGWATLEVENCVGSCGDSGATGGSSGSGSPIADGGVAVSAGAGGGPDVPESMTLCCEDDGLVAVTGLEAVGVEGGACPA